jgi:hypothetical protein
MGSTGKTSHQGAAAEDDGRADGKEDQSEVTTAAVAVHDGFLDDDGLGEGLRDGRRASRGRDGERLEWMAAVRTGGGGVRDLIQAVGTFDQWHGEGWFRVERIRETG